MSNHVAQREEISGHHDAHGLGMMCLLSLHFALGSHPQIMDSMDSIFRKRHA